MHYYQHHIGDFIKATARLTDSQAMAYLRLIWMYYDSEKPLPNDVDVLSMQIGLPIEDVQLLLRAYFRLENNVWRHTRCDAEIAEYQAFVAKKSNAGKASAERRLNKRSTGVQQAFNDSSTDVQLTNNHKPITNNQIKKEPMVLPDWLDKDVWKAFVEMRSKIKKPLTETAVKLVWKKLERMKDAGHSTTQILENSISNCWLDVYEPKRPVNSAPNGLAGAI